MFKDFELQVEFGFRVRVFQVIEISYYYLICYYCRFLVKMLRINICMKL